MLLVNRLSLYLRREWLTLVLALACGLIAVDFITGPLVATEASSEDRQADH